jgi:hypothetical protein
VSSSFALKPQNGADCLFDVEHSEKWRGQWREPSRTVYKSAAMEDYQKEDWVALYRSALIELEQAKMSGRIEAAHKAIIARMEKLQTLPGLHPEERQAIEDALRSLHFLEREDARFTAEHKRLAVEKSLENVRSIGAAIERLKDSPEPD